MLAIVPVKVDPSAAVHPLVVEGFVDETLAWLARVGSLTVLSPSAVVRVGRRAASVARRAEHRWRDGRAERCAATFGDELQLHVRLDDTATGAMLWADRLSFGEQGLPEAQSRLAESVTSVLGMNLTAGER